MAIGVRRPWQAVDYDELVRRFPPPPEYFELRERARSFSEIGAYRSSAVNLSEGDSPERVNALARGAA